MRLAGQSLLKVERGPGQPGIQDRAKAVGAGGAPDRARTVILITLLTLIFCNFFPLNQGRRAQQAHRAEQPAHPSCMHASRRAHALAHFARSLDPRAARTEACLCCLPLPHLAEMFQAPPSASCGLQERFVAADRAAAGLQLPGQRRVEALLGCEYCTSANQRHRHALL